MRNPEENPRDEFREAVTTTVIWVAGVTLAVIFISLFAGISLDSILHTKPWLTIVFTIASIPVTIVLTLRIVNRATKKVKK